MNPITFNRRVGFAGVAFCALLSACTSVAVTTANTTTPVLIGPVERIEAARSADGPRGRVVDLEQSAHTFYFIMGSSSGGTQRDSSQRVVSSNEFDGELLMAIDTRKEYVKVAAINIGSYSLLNILFGAFHKTWAGIEGVIQAKDGGK